MAYNNLLKANSRFIQKSLDLVSRKWKISQAIYDLHLGKREDLDDTLVNVGSVIFHIPTLTRDDLFVLWRCLWPDCDNCCKRSNFIPLTVEDIQRLSKRMGYGAKANFIKRETLVSSWVQKECSNRIESIRTHISLKRKDTEKEKDEGSVMKCRFLNDGGCGIHDSKPSVCSMYPFVSYLENDTDNRPIVHAQFQFTGDCPGFYLEKSLDHMMPVLREYSKIIYEYTMASIRTQRENYCANSIIDLNKQAL